MQELILVAPSDLTLPGRGSGGGDERVEEKRGVLVPGQSCMNHGSHRSETSREYLFVPMSRSGTCGGRGVQWTRRLGGWRAAEEAEDDVEGGGGIEETEERSWTIIPNTCLSFSVLIPCSSELPATWPGE